MEVIGIILGNRSTIDVKEVNNVDLLDFLSANNIKIATAATKFSKKDPTVYLSSPELAETYSERFLQFLSLKKNKQKAKPSAATINDNYGKVDVSPMMFRTRATLSTSPFQKSSSSINLILQSCAPKKSCHYGKAILKDPQNLKK